MRITTVSRYKVVAAMTRGFFQAFISGNVDATQPGKKEIAPLEYKKIIADNYEKLSACYVSVMFPILIRLNYADGEAVAEDMKRRNFSNETSPKILLRYACGSKEVYDAAIKEYQQQIAILLTGRLQTITEFFENYERGTKEVESVDVALAIRSMVRTQMMAYSMVLKAANPEMATLHQATVFRLMLQGTMALLHEEPVSLEGDNLELIFRRVALNSDNFEVLMNEMNQAYEDLV